MLTLFAVPKPFRGHIAVIQRNALRSWLALRPQPEVILFGDEEGIAEAASELGVRHFGPVARTPEGTPRLDDVFDQAHRLAAHDILCYANGDIILLSDFRDAVARVEDWAKPFLMVGRRWDIELDEELDTAQAGWEVELREHAQRTGVQRTPEWIDYFVFSRGVLTDLLPFALGRAGFDNWLLWKAASSGAALVDASTEVVAIHQNHDYSHHTWGAQGVWEGPEARRNRELMGDKSRCYFVTDATHRLRSRGVHSNFAVSRLWRYWQRTDRMRRLRRGWYGLMTLTEPLRRSIGLRREPMRALTRRIRSRV